MNWVLSVIGVSAAMIVVSQSISFGRWNEFSSTARNFNFHSVIFLVVGIGMLSLSALCSRLMTKIAALEKQIRSPNLRPEDTAPKLADPQH